MTAISMVREYLDSKGFDYTITGSEATLNCPLCGDHEKKFSINLDTGAWKCFHANKCGRSGNLYQLRQEIGDIPIEIRKQKTEYKLPEVKAKALGAEVSAWFAGRKIFTKTLERFRIRQTEDGQIAFPYLKDGQLVNVKYRRLPKTFSQEKDAEPVLFARDLVPAESDQLVIVEGEMDVLAAWEYETVTVSVPGGAANTRWIDREWDFLKRFKRICLALDGDEAGEKGVQEIARRLSWDWDLYRVELPLNLFSAGHESSISPHFTV